MSTAQEKPKVKILVRFLHVNWGIKMIMSKHFFPSDTAWKDQSFHMFRDLLTEIVKRRSVKMETFNTAKRRGIPAAFSQAKPDKLYIRGRLWPVGKELPP